MKIALKGECKASFPALISVVVLAAMVLTVPVWSALGAGDGYLLKRSEEETCHSCHKTDKNAPSDTNAIRTHSSTNIGSTKWNGSWGTQGGKYGAFGCTTCHTAHDTRNIYLIKETIATPDGSGWGSTGSSSMTVDFRWLTGTGGDALFTMGDDSDSHTTSVRICEVCHSITSVHRYNASGQSDKSHNNSIDCTACHSHKTAFKGLGSCIDCHNRERNKTLGSWGTKIRQVTGEGGDFVRLSRHVSNGTASEIVTLWDCIVCHAEGDADSLSGGPKSGVHNDSPNGYINLRDVDNYTVGWTINNRAYTEQMRTDQDNFCLACHDSDGASQIAVNNAGDGLLLGSAASSTTRQGTATTTNLMPFNLSDNLRNGRDNFTTRTKVIDVESQFAAGSGGPGQGYNGNSSQHAVLGGRYSTVNSNWLASTWTNHVNRKGLTASSARETARLHCSDCHLSETNAHGASNAWHMLLNGVPNDYSSDASMGGLQLRANPSINVCYKCHNQTVYTGGGAASGSRFDHSVDSNWDKATYGSASGNDQALIGAPCLNCHAGDGFGNIHGVNGTYSPGGSSGNGTYNRYRFMPGAYMQWKPGSSGGDGDWAAASNRNSSCYFSSSKNWTNCMQHDSKPVTGKSTNYGRAVKY